MIDDTSKEFIKRHIGPSEQDQKKILNYIGSKSIDQLMIDTVPNNILLKEQLKINRSMSESDALKKLKSISKKNEKELDGREIYVRDLSGDKTLIYFDKGEYVELQTFDFGVRFLLISGKAIKEPIAWHGPIVMNSRDELMQALKDLKTGNFIK